MTNEERKMVISWLKKQHGVKNADMWLKKFQDNNDEEILIRIAKDNRNLDTYSLQMLLSD